MNVLLIQPPAPQAAVQVIAPTPAGAEPFSPPTHLLSLKGYLQERTRHTGHVIDCRLFTSLEQELQEAVATLPQPYVVAINTSTSGLGETSALLEIAKRLWPSCVTVLFGQHPSQFPQRALLPSADFALAGDPEPILRNLLDCMGMEQRLHRIPGLVMTSGQNQEAYWLPTLKGLALPDWDAVFWRSYQLPGSDGVRATTRISRGHTGTPADRALGHRHEPLRIWPMDRLAVSLQRCSVHGIYDLFLDDPPGFWTIERLREWCAALERVRNMQPWSFQLLPAILTEDIVRTLAARHCCRVQFTIPSCDPEVLELYDCTVEAHDLNESAALLRSYRIPVHLRFLVGSPEERGREEERIIKYLRAVKGCTYALAPFPFSLDAPVYDEWVDACPAPRLSDWMEWAWTPWTCEKPFPFWGGQEHAELVEYIMTRVSYAMKRSPLRFARNVFARVGSRNWIQLIEECSSKLLPHSGE